MIDPLNFDAFSLMKDNEEQTLKKFEDLGKEELAIDVQNFDVDNVHIQSDSTRMEVNKEWQKAIVKDIYIYEAMQVIEDIESSRK